MNREPKQSASSVPFFARYLEEQESLQVKTDVKAGIIFVTLKYPSDTDEIFHTLKYPSDSDEV
jgi:hypothetical protein